ncbi:hypothetical protein [Chitinophaga polysaccharea]|uniref:hypothetical protein n=1 Tax=Chitinophaga polysaccharea TaxID=1293035 RepID=UPI001158063A|nr:hypothetical protein [Chitinophaga polysaccharea]
MYPDYQSLVLKDYQEKKAGNALSLRLRSPTPAQIRDECIAVCEERYQAKDEQVLRTFFGKRDDVAGYILAIRKHDTDRFKPLVNYLRGQVASTDQKNTELLAWLINFEPRPFQLGKKYDAAGAGPELTEEEKEEEEQEAVTGKVDKSGTNVGVMKMFEHVPEKAKPGSKNRVIIILAFLIIFIGSGSYWLLNRKPSKIVLTGKESCMYWAGDHYEPVSCNQKFKDTLVVALDSVMLHRFKKITKPDTITGRAKGYVWYVKVDEGIEFYTSDGYHPIYHQKRLRPLTDYIIYKYVRPN